MKSNQETFMISSEDVNGPLNLQETLTSAQTSEPEWLREDYRFTNVEELNGIPVRYTLAQSGSADDFAVHVGFLSTTKSKETPRAIKSHLRRILGLDDDLRAFYRTFGSYEEPLSQTFGKMRGLRLMRSTNLFESLICSILSQNNSVLLWNRTARLIMRYYGRRVRFPDGSEFFLFPEPARLAKVRVRELRAKTSMGYRARSVIAASRLVVSGGLQLERLASLGYEDAMEMLLDLYGVGPKVADCFLLYGLGKLEAAPVDVWIHRITRKLYFRNRCVSKIRSATFLRERFGDWAGYAQLYLFDFARRSALSSSRA